MSPSHRQPGPRTPADRSCDSSPPLGWLARDLSFRYDGAERDALRSVSLSITAGLCTAVLGPNGSGKSTLLRLLLGILRPGTGSVHFGGRELASWSRREIARVVGVVPQNEEISFPLCVRELVAMGRYPFLGPLQPERAVDRLAIEQAMSRCDVAHLHDRPFHTLSGGERQRARLARALAQDPRVLALDEPTLALDLRHEMEIFELLHHLVRDGVTVMVVTHNLNLAARYADAILLLADGEIAAAGAPGEVLRRELLERIYAWPLHTYAHPGPGPDRGAVQVTPLAGMADEGGSTGKRLAGPDG